jgi:hypothetical protein
MNGLKDMNFARFEHFQQKEKRRGELGRTCNVLGRTCCASATVNFGPHGEQAAPDRTRLGPSTDLDVKQKKIGVNLYILGFEHRTCQLE